ncbi:hypothetical protein GSI_09528 [Ganoderma sinense ZZ0214-1]|uniref:Uncharacterized protein n=1 Tax=Ganoderma sinense ZZ0214-1 TaxID=1077348 RepID=A0A2G8S3S4_9APHY|nr:hypothetical protein GSI_09528 [Ganoderma sinense ZZ0214-1]
MPSQGSYDYLYQANIGLQNLHSVWAHAPRSDSKENCRTLKHGKTSGSTAASLYDTSSPYAAELFALRLEYRLACALGKRSIQLRDRSVNRSADPNPDAFDDDANPFVVAQAETEDPTNRQRPAVDNPNNDSQQTESAPNMAPPLVLSPLPLENMNMNTPPTRCDTPPAPKATPTPPPAHAPKARRATRPRRPDPSECRWQAPGPSPLSHSFTAHALTEQDDPSASFSDDDDDDECFARAFRRHTRRPYTPSIIPLPRTLNGSSTSRSASKMGTGGGGGAHLRRELHRSRFLRRVCGLDVEAPELDSVDERSMEWLLDTQADLLRGRCPVPALAHFALVGSGQGQGQGGAPRLGTAHRRLKWVQGSGFPRRVKDYGSAAEDMLARRRAQEGIAVTMHLGMGMA